MASQGDAVANPLRWTLGVQPSPADFFAARTEVGAPGDRGQPLWRSRGSSEPADAPAAPSRKRGSIGAAVAQLFHATTRAFSVHGAERNGQAGIFERTGLQNPQSPELLQELLDAVAVEMALLDEDGLVIAANASWRDALVDPQLAGKRECVGLSYLAMCKRLCSELDIEALRKGLDELLAGRCHEFATPYLGLTRQGLRWRRLRITSLSPGSLAALVAIHENIAPHPQTVSCDSPEGRLVVQEEERQRLTIELHDSTCQHLAALGLGVTRLRRLVGHDDGAEDVLEDMSKSVGEVVKEIRVLSYLTKPPGLERDGLADSVRSFVQGFGARTGLNASLRIDGPVDDAPAAVQHAAFRIIQEAASNVYRHAAAAHVDIHLGASGGILTVRIADDGKGIAGLGNGARGQVLAGVGLAGMQTRVSKLQGRLDISCPGRGTVVSAALPWRPSQAEVEFPSNTPPSLASFPRFEQSRGVSRNHLREIPDPTASPNATS